MSRWKTATVGVLSVLALALSACAAAAAETTPAARAEQTSVEKYRIGAEDVLHISVWKNEAMSRTVPVRPDGMISLPLLNDVAASGLTPIELRDVITKKLTDYIPNPEVSVILTELRSFKVSVMGEVARPARYELKSATTVLDVLAMAGGFTQFAARQRIVVLRADGKAMKRVPFNYNKVVVGEQENLYLQRDDIVLVP